MQTIALYYCFHFYDNYTFFCMGQSKNNFERAIKWLMCENVPTRESCLSKVLKQMFTQKLQVLIDNHNYQNTFERPNKFTVSDSFHLIR